MHALVARTRRWLDRWGALVPILVVEFVVLLGFGALLPVLPLFVVDHGIDVPTLGVITAAWPIGRLVTEPLFGWLADRVARKPMMVAGIALLGVFMILQLVFTTAVALAVLRFVSGVAVSIYDPPARATIVDATREGERGEAFGLYSAAQMGGLLLGPVFGGLGTALGGGFAFPFVLVGVLSVGSAVWLAIVLPARPSLREGVEPLDVRAAPPGPLVQAPLGALANRLLIAAVLMNLGGSLAVGVYEVVWSLFLTAIGASIEWVGFTFTLFGIPMLFLSPLAGRLADRSGALGFATVGGLGMAGCGILYSLSTEPVFPAFVILVESVALAFYTPALYALLAEGTPPGRSATAQGIYGSASQVGIIGASLLAGVLFAADPRWPFWFFAVTATLTVALGVAVGWRARPVRVRAAVPLTGLMLVAFVLASCTVLPPLETAPPPTPAPTAPAVATPSPAPGTPPPTGSPGPTPQRTPFAYTIRTGDSLTSIAERFELTISQLLAANPQITDPDHIEVGDVLTIPPPDAPSGLPLADEIADARGDLLDASDQPAFAPGYVDLIELEARVDAQKLYVELITVSAPPPADPEVEQLDYTVVVDTTGDGEPEYRFLASNTLDPSGQYAAVVVQLSNGATSPLRAFPGAFTVGPTVRFEVFRNVLGEARAFAVAAMAERRFYPAGLGDPDVETAVDRVPDQQWPRVNARWLEVGF